MHASLLSCSNTIRNHAYRTPRWTCSSGSTDSRRIRPFYQSGRRTQQGVWRCLGNPRCTKVTAGLPSVRLVAGKCCICYVCNRPCEGSTECLRVCAWHSNYFMPFAGTNTTQRQRFCLWQMIRILFLFTQQEWRWGHKTQAWQLQQLSVNRFSLPCGLPVIRTGRCILCLMKITNSPMVLWVGWSSNHAMPCQPLGTPRFVTFSLSFNLLLGCAWLSSFVDCEK